MKRRIISNIVLAFIIVPIIKLIFDYIKIKDGSSFFLGSFIEYEKLMALTTFLILPLGFAIFILLPYNLIITRRKKSNLISKIILFELIIIICICIIGTFHNIWMSPYWKNIYYLIGSSIYSCLFATAIHFFVDKKN
ncbi:hypothetical protein ACS5PU_06710 [Pedobacter sp. GSP4]|uniref:hypothetical protein n=1 Tax=Pedobacter sp. GSP4 TaxID=3453716 RepID=UPI003EEF79AD